MRIRQFRNGKELRIIMEDNHYDFNFQSSRQPRAENGGRVLPGDELFVECDYETSNRKKPTFGGRFMTKLLKIIIWLGEIRESKAPFKISNLYRSINKGRNVFRIHALLPKTKTGGLPFFTRTSNSFVCSGH